MYNIEQVATLLGLHVFRHKALCPFHDDSNPSLSFHVGRNRYRCFVCGAHGDAIDLVRGVTDLGYREACQWLDDHYGRPTAPTTITPPRRTPATPSRPDLPYLSDLVRYPILNAEASTFLFSQRHYNPRVVQWLGLSSISHPTPCRHDGRPFYDAPSLLIPYRDVDGQLLSVQSRYLGPPAPEGQRPIPRFRFPAGTRAPIYNLPILHLLRPGEPIYLSEGITDCIALLSSGHKALGIPSASLFGPAEASLLADLSHRLHTPFHIFPDQDDAGQRLYAQLESYSHQHHFTLIRHHLPPTCKDYSDLYTLTVTTPLP